MTKAEVAVRIVYWCLGAGWSILTFFAFQVSKLDGIEMSLTAILVLGIPIRLGALFNQGQVKR